MKNTKVVILIIIYAVILILIGVLQPREVDWRATFAANDKIPYGTYVLKQRLGDFFNGSKITTVSESIYKTLHKKTFANTNYVFIEPKWNPGANDVRELLRFTSEGNNVFIASQSIPYCILDTLGLYQRYALPAFIKKITRTDTLNSIPVSLVNPAFAKDSVYEFESNNQPLYFAPGYAHLEEDEVDSTYVDSTYVPLAKQAIVLSTVSHTNPIYLKIPVGKGNIYLHSFPYAFTNYYILKDSTRDYAMKCLSYLPNGNVLWDEHYKVDRQNRHASTLGFILTNASLRWAYYAGLTFIFIFLLFSIKRRQRIIPVVEPFRNTTLEFTETIGRLYFNRGDHKNLAQKKIRHFLEYVRSRYFIDTQDLNSEFIIKLSSKSGIEYDRVKYMAEVMKSLLVKQPIADSELIQLNEVIEYFKKNSN